MQTALDNKRIAKNAVTLYFRMLFQMAVYLYTSRVIIDVLGFADYGIYDVVGGFVGILAFLNNSMTTCTQRYITFAIGSNESCYLNRVYSASVIIHLLLAVGVFILGETVGLWYMYHYMVIPVDRFQEALVVFHCSLLSGMCLIISVPYNATIIAYEKMTAFAVITILDVSLKLAIVLFLPYIQNDKLIVYAVCMVVEALLVRLVYGVYCHIKFNWISFVWKYDGLLLKEMMGFAGWSTMGNAALVCNTQGLNLILNIMGGPVINAARGVAFQVQTAITSFTASFQTAINPQITKSYACQDVVNMNRLILQSSKFSSFLLLFIIIPLGMEMETVLNLWLKNVPNYALLFTRILLCVSLVDALANPMMVGAAATGRIKKYHIAVGGTLLCVLPLAFVGMRWFDYEIVFEIQLLVAVVAQIVRMKICRTLYGFSSVSFLCKVLWPVGKVLVVVLPLSFVAHLFLSGGFWGVVRVGIVCCVLTAITVYYLGLSPYERDFVLRRLKMGK